MQIHFDGHFCLTDAVLTSKLYLSSFTCRKADFVTSGFHVGLSPKDSWKCCAAELCFCPDAFFPDRSRSPVAPVKDMTRSLQKLDQSVCWSKCFSPPLSARWQHFREVKHVKLRFLVLFAETLSAFLGILILGTKTLLVSIQIQRQLFQFKQCLLFVLHLRPPKDHLFLPLSHMADVTSTALTHCCRWELLSKWILGNFAIRQTLHGLRVCCREIAIMEKRRQKACRSAERIRCSWLNQSSHQSSNHSNPNKLNYTFTHPLTQSLTEW